MARKEETLGEEMKNLLTGLQTALPSGTQAFPVGSVVQTVPAIIQTLQTFVGDWTAADDSGVKHHADVLRRDGNAPAARSFVNELKLAVFTVMGSTNPALVNFGLKPKKERQKLTGDQRVRATAKAKATREARHTLGPRAKAQIKGEVPPPPTAK
jgi:hypothetical protein